MLKSIRVFEDKRGKGAVFLAAVLFFSRPVMAVEFTEVSARDPFAPLIQPKAEAAIAEGSFVIEAPPGFYTLQGIVWGANPQAIINGEVVKAGDRLGSAEIRVIERKGVTLSENGREVLLKLEKK